MFNEKGFNGYDQRRERVRRKRIREDKRAFLISRAMISAGIVFSLLLGGLTGCSDSTATDQAEPSVVEHAEPSAYWKGLTRSHEIDITLALQSVDGSIYTYYFGNTVATGVCHDNGLIRNTELDSGFVLSVIDNDSVSVRFYNNSDDDVKPVLVTADVGGKTATSRNAKDEYIIKGYSSCKDGYGLVKVKLSNDYTLEAEVFKENGQLYVCNVTRDETEAKAIAKGIKRTTEFLASQDVTPENSISTDPIYYPIVPVNKGETTDVKPWIEQSKEIVEDDWTDAHKIYAMYEWCLNNFAYDSWIINRGEHSRWFHYNDFSGKQYFSQTHVGVCEDFAEAFAIMCRAQGIPAVILSNITHAWNAVYIADYGRWILLDLTEDVNMQAETEDVTAWRQFYDVTEKCTTFDVNSAYLNAKSAYIGNTVDMELQGIIP